MINFNDPFASNRRTFLRRSTASIGLAALGSLLHGSTSGSTSGSASGSALQPLARSGGMGAFPNFPAKAKRIIYLFQSGAPSQIDLFDYKPTLEKSRAKDLRAMPEIQMGQRLTGMTSGQATLPIAPSIFKFSQQGKSGIWLSELLPHTAGVVDKLCIIKSMFTEAINHDPAITFFQTGSQLAGRPSIGAWVAYGLGSENSDLPAYVVFTSKGTGRRDDQPLYDRLWGAGFLPTQYQGVRFRAGNEPVLYLNDPPGVDRSTRREMLDEVASLNNIKHDAIGDPEITTRVRQYEMAFRMQASVPELTEISKEPQSVLDLYGPDVHKPGTFARNCLLARRLSERGVRFVQLFHMGWDHHGNLPNAIRGQCSDTDQASAGLLRDLQQRGMLEDTLVVWGGEFGRTVYSQGALTMSDYGRDHHPRCFSLWMAGAGVKQGFTLGETDAFSYNIVRDPVHVHDLNATILHLMGIDHERLTFKFQGRQFRLTDVRGSVVNDILA